MTRQRIHPSQRQVIMPGSTQWTALEDGAVRSGNWGTFNKVCYALREHLGAEGVAAESVLRGAIIQAVEFSFEPDQAPMRRITRDAIRERLDKCVGFCLDLIDDGHTVHRIVDELPRLLVEGLGAGEQMTRRRRAWGVGDGIRMVADKTEDMNDG